MAAASAVFIAVLLFTTRKRISRPGSGVLLLLASVVVVLGMLFARYAAIFLQPPRWIYYGFPAVVTFLLPPAALRMRRREIVQYLPLALVMGPAIHLFFSLLIGWHDYMPFIYIPSFREIFQRIL